MVRRRTREKRIPTEYTYSLTELEDCISDGNTAEQKLEVQLLAKAISQYLRELPQETRNLFLCRYYYLDSLKDAAKYCNMSEAKAKTLLYRTRQGLKEYLEKEGFYI